MKKVILSPYKHSWSFTNPSKKIHLQKNAFFTLWMQLLLESLKIDIIPKGLKVNAPSVFVAFIWSLVRIEFYFYIKMAWLLKCIHILCSLAYCSINFILNLPHSWVKDNLFCQFDGVKKGSGDAQKKAKQLL